MFCTSCGARLDGSAKFCTNCGKPTAPADIPPPPPHKLRRVIARKKLAGVCAGFAEYFGMDLTLMRLIWVGLLLIPPHLGAIAYLVSWAVLPTDQKPGEVSQ